MTGLLAVASVASATPAERPAPEMLRVLELQPEGPRITPFLTHQIDRAWAFDAARQVRFARVATEADLRALQDELRRKALDADRRAAGSEDAAPRARHRDDPDGRLPYRQARLREPARHPRHRPRLRARRPHREKAGGARGLRTLGDRQGVPFLSGDRRPPRAARVRRPLLGSRGPGRAQPVLGPGAWAQPLQPRLRRARGPRQLRDDRRHEPGALHGVGRDAGRRLPAHAGRRRRQPSRDHGHERRRLPGALDRRSRHPHRGRPALVLPDRAPHAHGEPHLRGPGQRPRAGPAGPRLRGDRPPGPPPPRLPAAAPRLGGRPRLLSHRGGAEDDAGDRRSLPPLRPRGPRRAQRGLPQAPVLGREPGEGVRLSRPRLRPAGLRGARRREDPRARGAVVHAEGPGARGPGRTLADGGDPRRREGTAARGPDGRRALPRSRRSRHPRVARSSRSRILAARRDRVGGGRQRPRGLHRRRPLPAAPRRRAGHPPPARAPGERAARPPAHPA